MSSLFISTTLFFSMLSFSNETASLVNTNIQWSQEQQGTINADVIIASGRNFNVVKGESYPLVQNSSNNLVAQLPLANLDVGITVGKNLSTLNIANLNFLLSEDKNLFSLDLFDSIPVNKAKMEIHKLDALCGKKIDKKSMLSIIFSSCFSNGHAKLKSALFPGVIAGEKIDLKVTNHKFQLSGNLLNPIQGSVKIKGISNYYLANNELVIEVQSAKLEFFNIRSRLFKELNKLKSTKIKIEEPFINIKFN